MFKLYRAASILTIFCFALVIALSLRDTGGFHRNKAEELVLIAFFFTFAMASTFHFLWKLSKVQGQTAPLLVNDVLDAALLPDNAEILRLGLGWWTGGFNLLCSLLFVLVSAVTLYQMYTSPPERYNPIIFWEALLPLALLMGYLLCWGILQGVVVIKAFLFFGRKGKKQRST